MDDEFGVGELVQGTLEHQKPQVSAAYVHVHVYADHTPVLLSTYCKLY